MAITSHKAQLKHGLIALLLLAGMIAPYQTTRQIQAAGERKLALETLGNKVNTGIVSFRNTLKEYRLTKLQSGERLDRNTSASEAGRNLNYWIADGERYPMKKLSRKPVLPQKNTTHYFYTGNCTHYINAIYYIPWRGNAIRWIDNARELGYTISDTPEVGDLLITSEGARTIGHVALVEKVTPDTIVISEMNFMGYGYMTERTIPLSYSKIKGYIKGSELERQTAARDLLSSQVTR